MQNEVIKQLNPYGKLRPEQMAAAEMKAATPGITYKEIANKIGVTAQTIQEWFKNVNVVDATYDRFMEIAGIRLPKVLDAMLREAEEGNVNAATLVLKHWGKLQDTSIIKIIDSPFEKFIKLEAIDAEVIEQNGNGSMAEVLEAVKEIPITTELPKRNKKNDKPKARAYRQGQRLRKSITDSKRKARKNTAYALRKRAAKVGLELLPAARQKNHVRKAWLKELERLEKGG